MRSLGSARARLLALSAVVLFTAGPFAVSPASAQIGTAITPITVASDPGGFVYIAFGSSSNQWKNAELLGGVTVFAADAPNGTLLARLPLLPPFQSDDFSTPPGWTFTGVPAGTYYIAMVNGIVGTPSIPANAWARLDVTGSCAGVPGMALLNRDLNAGPSAVRVTMTAFGSCARSFLIEAGTSPGAANIASFEQGAAFLDATGVPAGSYYLRVRAKNPAGVGAYSAVLPLPVPACPAEIPDEVDDLTATVVGNTVTLSWTPPATPPGRPVTYYELAVLSAAPPGSPAPRYLLPGSMTSISAALPSGTYQVLMYAGNSCGSESGSGVVTFTVP